MVVPVLPSPASSGRLRVNLGGGGAAAAGGFSRNMLSPAVEGSNELPPAVAAASATAAAATAAAAAACSAAAASSAAGPRRDGAQVAPREAKEKLRRAREAFKLTASQFAGLLSTPGQAVNQQLLTHWEMGIRRVPQPVLLKVEQMHAQLLKEQRLQKEAEIEENGSVVMVNPEYPYQEPMIGPDYQVGVPRSTSGSSKQRADECIWSPRLAVKDVVGVEPYLHKVRELLKDCEELRPGGGATYEEIALDVLNELQYNPQEALDALQLCVAWRRGDEKAVLALSRGAVVNSMCWLRRLSETKKRRTFREGEVEAMDWGLTQCGRDVTEIGRHVLREKDMPELIEMYYHAPRKTAHAARPGGAVFGGATARSHHGLLGRTPQGSWLPCALGTSRWAAPPPPSPGMQRCGREARPKAPTGACQPP